MRRREGEEGNRELVRSWGAAHGGGGAKGEHMKDKNEIQKKIDGLRKQWVKYPEKRKIIEIQAKILKKALIY